MARNDNWGYLPDYSNQNHTLKFARKARGFDVYRQPEDRIPVRALVGGVCFVLGLMGIMWLGYFVGY